MYLGTSQAGCFPNLPVIAGRWLHCRHVRGTRSGEHAVLLWQRFELTQVILDILVSAIAAAAGSQ